MKIAITYDLSTMDPRDIGQVLSDLAFGVGRSGRDMAVAPGWTASDVPVTRPVAVAMMGDEIYERPDYEAVIRHYRHETLPVDLFIASCCGATEVLFQYEGRSIQGEAGRGKWSFTDLQDARNDPAHLPWASLPLPGQR